MNHLIPQSTSSDVSNKPDDRHCLLLPTKVYTYPQQADHDDTVSPFTCAHPNGPVLWKAQPVLQWVESLVAATEAAEVQDSKHAAPIMIDGVKLGEPLLLYPGVLTAVCYNNKKQGAELQDEDYSMPLLEQDQMVFPAHWDNSYLQRQDPLAWMFVQHMNHYAVHLESLASFDTHAYQVLQSRLAFTFARLVGQYPPKAPMETGELRTLLDALYKETIQKLKDLIHDKVHDTSNKSTTTSSPPPSSVSTGSPRNRDFTKYMNAWLCENWTNPYPDETGLEEMARDCDMPVTVVSNWLINARTRKWRPAIVKATNMNRPSHMLLEDSICIFEGKALRDIQDVPSRHDNNGDLEIEEYEDEDRARGKRVKKECL